MIQRINGEIDGVEFAPEDEYHRRIVSSTLPVVYTLVGNGQMLMGSDEMTQVKQLYRILCYVDSVKSGEISDPTNRAHKLLALFLETWADLSNDDNKETLDDGSEVETTGTRIQIDRSVPIRHTGVRHDMVWLPDVFYVGFEITLPILIHYGTEVF
jgi:hypothetical protein